MEVLVLNKLLAIIVEGDPKAPISIATTPLCRGERYSIPWIAPLEPYLIVLSAQQSGIKYYFLSLWYDSTWDWTHLNHLTVYKQMNNGLFNMLPTNCLSCVNFVITYQYLFPNVTKLIWRKCIQKDRQQ